MTIIAVDSVQRGVGVSSLSIELAQIAGRTKRTVLFTGPDTVVLMNQRPTFDLRVSHYPISFLQVHDAERDYEVVVVDGPPENAPIPGSNLVLVTTADPGAVESTVRQWRKMNRTPMVCCCNRGNHPEGFVRRASQPFHNKFVGTVPRTKDPVTSALPVAEVILQRLKITKLALGGTES